jgi:hypothetical protein
VHSRFLVKRLGAAAESEGELGRQAWTLLDLLRHIQRPSTPQQTEARSTMAMIPSAVPIHDPHQMDIPTAQTMNMQPMQPLVTVVQFPCQACNSILQAPLGG